MNRDAMGVAHDFVANARLPAAPPMAAFTKAAFDYEEARAQALVVGSDIVAFVKNITPEQRQDIVNASLLAQLVAKQQVPAPDNIPSLKRWYEVYFDALSRIGFAIQDKGFAEYKESSDTFEAHEAILDVAAVLLAGAPGALALVKTTLDAMRKTASSGSWITLFSRESQSANAARFQVSLVDKQDTGLLVALIAFGLEARTTLTQVLFFKFHKNDVTLHHHSGKVTINVQVLEAVRAQLASRLVKYANAYIESLPEV